MGVYRSWLLPRLMDRAMSRPRYEPVRRRVCAPLVGDVLEIGFGSGRNLPHLPPSVSRVVAVDATAAAPRLAAERIDAATVPVEVVGVDAHALPMPDDSVDSALCTWTLCSVADPVAAVREIARVLRPGGVLRFVEHGRSPEPRVAARQRRLTPVQRRLAGGCHLDRDIPAILRDGGMTVTELATYHLDGETSALGWTFEGSAACFGVHEPGTGQG
jgi:SAM-dependent methyltransferase